MSTTVSSKLLQEMEQLTQAARRRVQSQHTVTSQDKLDNFSTVLKSQLDQVNQLQLTKDQLQVRYAKGDPSVTLPQIKVVEQQAKLAQTVLLEVRNKAIEAYKEITSMPL